MNLATLAPKSTPKSNTAALALGNNVPVSDNHLPIIRLRGAGGRDPPFAERGIMEYPIGIARISPP
jgi:hypothetical protein